jgi:hypothetical protein
MGLLQFAFEFQTLECGVCGIPFAMTTARYKKSLDDGKGFYCPEGHNLHFVETTKQKMEKEIANEKRRREWAEANLEATRKQRDRQERRARAFKGVLTKTKKRVGNGVCPCCNRTFQNLLNHMHAKHPDYKDAKIK